MANLNLQNKYIRYVAAGTGVQSSVADPHRKNADSDADPGKNLNADADPDVDADPDADADSCPY